MSFYMAGFVFIKLVFGVYVCLMLKNIYFVLGRFFHGFENNVRLRTELRMSSKSLNLVSCFSNGCL